MSKLVAVKVRSHIDARRKVEETMENLGLYKRNQAVVLDDSESIRGMLEVVKDYVTFGTVDEETVEELEGKQVSLSPPSGGYSDTKKNVSQGGSLGERENMDQLIQKMV